MEIKDSIIQIRSLPTRRLPSNESINVSTRIKTLITQFKKVNQLSHSSCHNKYKHFWKKSIRMTNAPNTLRNKTLNYKSIRLFVRSRCQLKNYGHSRGTYYLHSKTRNTLGIPTHLFDENCLLVSHGIPSELVHKLIIMGPFNSWF